MRDAGQRGWPRVALYGTSELAEVASLCEVPDVEIVTIVDPAYKQNSFANFPVVNSIETAGDIDALLLTALANPQATYDLLTGLFPVSRIFVPRLLRVGETPDVGTQA